MLAELLMFCILAVSPLAITHALCALNAMHHTVTRKTIIVGGWLQAVGRGVVFFAALDYLMQPVLWLWLLFIGVFLQTAGAAALYWFNRRECNCPQCPGRPLRLSEGKRHGHT